MKKIAVIILCNLLFIPSFYAQSGLENTLKAGELLLGGLTILKTTKEVRNTDTAESVCVKNKLTEKITFVITGKDAEGNEVKKELIVQSEGKECFFNLSKGIYAYEVVLSNKDIYKKGEYKFDDSVIITIKKE